MVMLQVCRNIAWNGSALYPHSSRWRNIAMQNSISFASQYLNGYHPRGSGYHRKQIELQSCPKYFYRNGLQTPRFKIPLGFTAYSKFSRFSFLGSQFKPLMASSPARLHTSAFKRDIPHYLQGNVSEVTTIDDDLYDEFEDGFENDMEDEISEFLNSRLIPYEETESSFTIPCHTCSLESQGSRPQEIFVDKNSGYYVCPWCCQAGTWEELSRFLDVNEDCLTQEQLDAFFSTTVDISKVDLNMYNDSLLQLVSLATLKSYGARLTGDRTRVILPLKSSSCRTVGFESISLLYPLPQVVRRFIAEEPAPLCMPEKLKSRKRIIVVPSCCDVLLLAEYKIAAVALPVNALSVLCDYLTKDERREIFLWLGIKSPPRQLLQSLIVSQIPCWIVRCEENDSPIYMKSLKEVNELLKNVIPVVSEATTTFLELKNEIYHRLINKEETCGIQWKRFTGLNAILLGHRRGEMTVLTGPTGSGKTTLISEYSLDLCSQGVITLWGSFEVSVVRLCEVMLQQFSGTSLPVDISEFNILSSKFSNLPLHFLTYHGQQTTTSVLKAMAEAVKVWGVQHVIIDNLQFMLGTAEQALDRWWEQDKAVAAFRRFATLHNCHVTLIVHPKKVPDGQLLNINSIFGGAKLSQEADNVLILQVKDSNAVSQSKKALQVVKNRYGGQLGVMPLKFHQESLTFSSCFLQKSKADKETLPQPSEKTNSLKQVKGLKAFMN
ncbi:hypothetical protein SK128_018824 [Halocaridina rubra]|uniref:SF4 helicase domain-containing protein n=1 Tax=Halocaridina rubra TaxID=373956 RepID=A0AAN8WNK5_HALRR